MARKKDDDKWLILLLLLALSSLKGIFPNRPPAPDMGMTPTGAPPAGQPTNPASMTPTDKTGAMDKAKNYVINFMDNLSTMASAALDKGVNVSPFGTTPEVPTSKPSDNAGVMAAMNQLKAIAMGMFTKMGGLFVGSLPSPDNNPYASITTAVYNPQTMMYDTYTNNPPMMYPAGAMPPTPPTPAVQTMQSHKVIQPVPLAGLIDTGAISNSSDVFNYLKNQPSPMAPMSPLPDMTIKTLPAPSGTLPNPLPTHPSLLSGLENFGQASLNQLLNAGKDLTGAFNNLQNLFPVLGGVGSPRPLPIEVA